MESAVTETTEVVVATFQTVNSIISSICGTSIYAHILYRILRRNSRLSQYQELIVVQSVIGVLSILFRFLDNQTISSNSKGLFQFIPSHPVLEKVVYFLTAVLRSFEEFLIIVFNIHRVLILVRPHWIRKFYLFFSPLAFSYSIVYAGAVTYGPPLDLLGGIMGLLCVPAVMTVSIVCYGLINRHFRRVGGYTEKVKRMQTRLSTSICLQGAIHCVVVVSIVLAVPLYLLVGAITSDNMQLVMSFSLYYSLFVFIMLGWYSTATAALMLWSIRGFLKKQINEKTNAKSQVTRIAPYVPYRSNRSKSTPW